jgi:hypothetical protein
VSLRTCQHWSLENVDIDLPLDGKAGDSGLLGKDVALDFLDDGLSRRVAVQLFAVVLVVDIVANANKLPAIV